MGKDGIIVSDNRLSESSSKVESYLNDISEYMSNEASVFKLKANETMLNINNLHEDLNTTFVNENYNIFSPVDKKITNKKDNIIAEISLCEFQFNEFMEDFELSNNHIYHIDEVKDYIMKLEDIIADNYDSFSKSKKTAIKNEDNKDFRKGLQILQTQELERKRIARDLHDSTVQNLTSLIHKTELCSKYVDIDNIRTKLELEIMKKTIRTTINDMREIIFDLRPMSLDDLGLIPTVERYIEQIMQNNEVSIIFTYKDDRRDCPSIINFTLFRIIQEACNNVLKHAKANNIKIVLNYNDLGINLLIEDDGIGFDISNQMEESCKINSNFGLSIMKERIYLLSGQIQIESKINKGTMINITVPLNSYMEEKE